LKDADGEDSNAHIALRDRDRDLLEGVTVLGGLVSGLADINTVETIRSPTTTRRRMARPGADHDER
jgi:hypothetical protein